VAPPCGLPSSTVAAAARSWRGAWGVEPTEGEMQENRPGTEPLRAARVAGARRSWAAAITGCHRLAVMVTGALLLSAATASGVALDLDAYLEAARSGVAGEIAGRIYEERRRLDLPERPLPGTTVTLLPRPEVLTRPLDDVKRGARDSHDAFRAAVPRMLRAQQEHERAVRAAGGAGLVLTVHTGADGTFTVPNVPAGAWILIAREDTVVPKTGNQSTKTDRKMYRVPPALEAYRSVRLWVREITLAGGAVEAVELTDRNVWFSGVVEVRADDGR